MRRFCDKLLVLACLLNQAQCKKDPEAKGNTSAAQSSLTEGPLAFPNRMVAGEAAFDLIAQPRGAALVSGNREGGLSVMLLDDAGREIPPEIRVAAPDSGTLIEVRGAAVGTNVGLVWVTHSKSGESMTLGALGDLATKSFAPPLTLGQTTLSGGGQGGFVDIATSEDGAFVALRRGLDEGCSDQPSQRCADFAFRELGISGPEPRGIPMAVPSPCSPGLAGFVSLGGRFHYGFCSQAEGQTVTTHFMRQLSPFFVEVHRSFDGCTPLGATVADGDAVFVAECKNGRQALRVNAMHVPLRPLDLSDPKVGCERGLPVLRVAGEPPLELTLSEPRERLSLLLPTRFAPARSRTAWTGTTLLSAVWIAGQVSLRRYACRGSELRML